jgi:hypothetical protein
MTDDSAGAGVPRDAPKERAFSDELEGWLTSDQPKTLGSLNALFDERSFAVAITILMFPSALPIPTGGVTHVLEVVTLLLALQLVAGRQEIWLPKRWRERELGNAVTGKALPFFVRRVRWFEKYSRPRLVRAFGHRTVARLAGVVIIAFTIAALVAPPFSGLDTLPALGVVLIALGMILRDALYAIVGVVIGASGTALIIAIGREIVHVFGRLI